MKPSSLARLAATSLLLLLPRASAAQPEVPATPPADSAEGADVCTTAYEGAQEQMRPNASGSTLLVARESLRTCLRSSCKSWMVSDCAKWLAEVETRIPSVVFTAKTTGGKDLTDVRVLGANGAVLAERIDGRSLEMEPGPHDFVFVTADGMRQEKRALIREGEKAQNVSALFETAVETPAPQRTAPTLQPEPTTPTLRYVGYAAVGAGAVGLVIGTIFGLTSLSKKSDANCDTEGFCDREARADGIQAATVSTVSFIIGATLAAGGGALVLFTPSKTRRFDARVSPSGIGIGGTW